MIKLACFDLDDTLTRELNSVMFLCMLNGKLGEAEVIEAEENAGRIHWIDADYEKAKLFQGLTTANLRESYLRAMRPLRNIRSTVRVLNGRGIRAIVITAGPRQIADIARDHWGMDAAYGSDYEVKEGAFTGKILHHLGDTGKVACLAHYCEANNLSPVECVAVGDGYTDLPLFDYCGKSIALNASADTAKRATHAVMTDDLADILPFI